MNENELLRTVCAQNKRLAELGLVILTEGNVSQRHWDDTIAIKPSGVSYEVMLPGQMVLVVIKTGSIVGVGYNNHCKPSVDTPIHLEIYRRFPEVGGIAHTHSPYATIFAQNCEPIPCLGTTHADAFNGPIPVTRALTTEEIESGLERNTGLLISEQLTMDVPAVLVRHHGPFVFGKDAQQAVENALILEKVAYLAWHTVETPDTHFPDELRRAHYTRKHGKKASYGQP